MISRDDRYEKIHVPYVTVRANRRKGMRVDLCLDFAVLPRSMSAEAAVGGPGYQPGFRRVMDMRGWQGVAERSKGW